MPNKIEKLSVLSVDADSDSLEISFEIKDDGVSGVINIKADLSKTKTFDFVSPPSVTIDPCLTVSMKDIEASDSKGASFNSLLSLMNQLTFDVSERLRKEIGYFPKALWDESVKMNFLRKENLIERLEKNERWVLCV